MKDLIVVGGGTLTKEIIWLAESCDRNVLGVLDVRPETTDNPRNFPFIGNLKDWPAYDCEFVIGVGGARTRAAIANEMEHFGQPNYATLIHPSAQYSKSVKFGEGTMVCAGVVLTVDIEVGSHCLLNLNVTVGHETRLGNFVTVSPLAAISGNVHLASFSEVGTGAALRQGLNVGKGSLVGMGAVVTKDVPENIVVAGNPAKSLKELPSINEH